jgi:hypothetical protein
MLLLGLDRHQLGGGLTVTETPGHQGSGGSTGDERDQDGDADDDQVVRHAPNLLEMFWVLMRLSCSTRSATSLAAAAEPSALAMP